MLTIQCANIVPPSGGPVDKTPPKILKITPADSSLNIKPKKIEIVFDKYMELGDWNTILSISPMIEIQPQVSVNLRKVTITIPDTLLLDNTTYTIALGNTLKDNREGTPYENFTYTFSTGAYIDSLSLKGIVMSAERLNVDSQYIAVLYLNDGFEDSTILKKKPLYQTRVQNTGLFEFKNLPNREFRMFVLHDKDNDKRYHPLWDGIAFMDSIFIPATEIDSLPEFSLFYKQLDSLEKLQMEEMSTFLSSEQKTTMRPQSSTRQMLPKEGYWVNVDTTQIEKGTQEIIQPIEIYFNPRLIKEIHTEKLFLSFEKDGTEIQSLIDVKIKDSIVYIQPEWQEDSKYTLRLIKGWATDTAGQEINPAKYIFHSKKYDDYSTLSLKVNDSFINNNYWIIIYNETDSITSALITDSVMTFKNILPKKSAFDIYIFHDKNNDGKWTSGDYLKHIHPEPMYRHQQAMMLKAGWTHEEVFKIRQFNVSSSLPTGMRGAKDTEKEKSKD